MSGLSSLDQAHSSGLSEEVESIASAGASVPAGYGSGGGGGAGVPSDAARKKAFDEGASVNAANASRVANAQRSEMDRLIDSRRAAHDKANVPVPPPRLVSTLTESEKADTNRKIAESASAASRNSSTPSTSDRSAASSSIAAVQARRAAPATAPAVTSGQGVSQ